MSKTYEIRDTIYGFIVFNEWERDIINHPVFQRLRRIRQLSLSDMVYPGAMHTRFEHSLGVMHIATKMYEEIIKRRSDFLKAELAFTNTGLDRDRVIVRLSCLLHDVGHAPFSHATEELMDKDEKGKAYKHENYSAAAALFLMRDVIEDHPINQNYKIKAQENGKILLDRKHHRCIFQTPEIPDTSDLEYTEQVLLSLKDIPNFLDKAESSWYKPGPNDIPILLRPGKHNEMLIPLSSLSTVVKGLKNISQTRVYVPFERKKEADTIVSTMKK